VKHLLTVGLVAILTTGATGMTRADEKDANAIVDKAIKALGGEENLSKAKSHTTKTKATITFNGDERSLKTKTTVQGLDHYASEWESEADGNKFVTVVNGNKGWRKFGPEAQELDGDALANSKRMIYLATVPGSLVALKTKDFKVEAADEQKVAEKPAVGIKVTAPDGKDFTLYFDKESGLPVKLVAKVVGMGGDEFTMDSTYTDYKDYGGIKKATKITSTRDGEKFVASEITEFTVLDKVPDGTFDEPK
jgi:hypothetical protein